jgi:intracellular sulfur oxidation DsrE/DsrF family protein
MHHRDQWNAQRRRNDASNREKTMTNHSRRKFIGALAVSGATLAASRANAAPVNLDLAAVKKDTDVACLYHCDFGDPDRFAQLLTNMNNHLSVYEFDPMRIKLVIVAHGAGIKFFLEDLSGTAWEKDKDKISDDLYKRVVGLSKFGVEVYLCQITYKRQNIDLAKTRKDAFLKFVPSGVASVAELQGKGFAYLKVG